MLFRSNRNTSPRAPRRRGVEKSTASELSAKTQQTLRPNAAQNQKTRSQKNSRVLPRPRPAAAAQARGHQLNAQPARQSRRGRRPNREAVSQPAADASNIKTQIDAFISSMDASNKKTQTLTPSQRHEPRPGQRRNFQRTPIAPRNTGTLPAVQLKNNNNLKIYCLGGQEEVGRNSTVFEYGDDIIILDMGLQFPDEDMPGIDYIIPNTSDLENKKQNIRGVIFSHGHLDHIGAAPMMLERLGNPLIIGRNLTIALVKHRQEDYQKGTANKLKTLVINSTDQKITLGKFKISFFRVEHSIMDAVGVVIETPHGTVIHPGDWNLESDPMEGDTVTYEHLAKLPSPRILMLESLGATTNKVRVPVKTTQANLQKLIAEAPGRIIIGTFASQVERIKSLLEYAEQSGKKVALDGYSMKMNVKISQELGYIKIHKNTLIPIDQISKYSDNKIIVLCTGAQGESNAVFSRIVNGSHKYITINKTDTVVFSSSVIPGNEATIQKLKDQIYRLTERVIHSETMDIHSSGHSNREDIKAIINQIKPDYFIPVYAYYYMLVEAKKLAMTDGFKPDNIFVLENGRVIEFDNGRPRLLKERVNTDYVMVDGLGVGDISEVVLRDRQVMAEDGMIVVIATIYSRTGKLVGNPDIISRGFIYMKNNRDLIEDTRKKIREIVEGGDTKTKADENFIKNKLRNNLGQYLFQKTERRPMVLPVIIKV